MVGHLPHINADTSHHSTMRGYHNLGYGRDNNTTLEDIISVGTTTYYPRVQHLPQITTAVWCESGVRHLQQHYTWVWHLQQH